MGFRNSTNHWKYKLPLFAGIGLVAQYDNGNAAWVPPWLVPSAPAGIYPPTNPIPPWEDGMDVPEPVLWFDAGDPSTVIGRLTEDDVATRFRVDSWLNKGTAGGAAIAPASYLRPVYKATSFPLGSLDFDLTAQAWNCEPPDPED